VNWAVVLISCFSRQGMNREACTKLERTFPNTFLASYSMDTGENFPRGKAAGA
jgi:hypothetical protein